MDPHRDIVRIEPESLTNKEGRSEEDPSVARVRRTNRLGLSCITLSLYRALLVARIFRRVWTGMLLLLLLLLLCLCRGPLQDVAGRLLSRRWVGDLDARNRGPSRVDRGRS